MSSVLHMGDRSVCGARAIFCWNDGIFRRSWCVTVRLPCAMRVVYAHGNKTMPATDVTVPHDSAVPTDTGHARVCNTLHPRQARASVEPARGYPARPIRPPAPKNHTLTGMTDLDAELDRSRRGLRPISARVATDLEPEYYRSRERRSAERGVAERDVLRRRGAARGTTWAGPARRRAHSRSA